MPIFLHTWEISDDLQKQFRADWGSLTHRAVEELGAEFSTLYQREDGVLMSIACWSSESAWRRWKEVLRTHPFREKYRRCKCGEPIRLTLLQHVERKDAMSQAE